MYTVKVQLCAIFCQVTSDEVVLYQLQRVRLGFALMTSFEYVIPLANQSTCFISEVRGVMQAAHQSSRCTSATDIVNDITTILLNA